jgi:hypothetical protein
MVLKKGYRHRKPEYDSSSKGIIMGREGGAAEQEKADPYRLLHGRAGIG